MNRLFYSVTGVSMLQSASSDAEKKIVAILKVLSESSESLGSITIARELERYGIFLSERAVRYHLKIADERGYTQPMGRDGRMLTPRGLEELKSALAPDQINFVQGKLELLAFRTTLDPIKRAGLVAINTSLFDKDRFKKAMTPMGEAFKAGLCVSPLVAVASEGDKLGDVIIPSGKIGIATVCSVTINGVMLKAGVPVEYKFGGVLEIKNSNPRRFTAVISYSGTSLDPSEQYILAKMTSVRETARTGNGRVLANFREIPAAARSTVEKCINELKDAGISGVSILGNTSEPVCQIAVGPNRIGMVMLGGLNPVAAAVEAGIEVENISESGMIEFNELRSFWELYPERGK